MDMPTIRSYTSNNGEGPDIDRQVAAARRSLAPALWGRDDRATTRRRAALLLLLIALGAAVWGHAITPDRSAPSLADRRPLWAVIGGEGSHLASEQAAGVRATVIRLSWKDVAPARDVVDREYIAQMGDVFSRARQAGLGVILELGIQDTPDWVHADDPRASYVDQYGDVYSGQGQADSGDANAVFDPRARDRIATYMRTVFGLFGTDWVAVRLGGGRYGELSYPPPSYHGRHNCYWAYDASAQARSPVPGWRPGAPAPHGEAGRFLNGYLDALAGYQNWQIATLRREYHGPIMMLYPSFGIRPGQVEQAVADGLDGASPAEVNGETERGVDYARDVAALTDTETLLDTTWLNCPFGNDNRADPVLWRPVHYLAVLAHRHRPALELYGENSGEGDAAQLRFSIAQARRYGLRGLAWFNEDQLFSGRYATLSDYQRAISA